VTLFKNASNQSAGYSDYLSGIRQNKDKDCPAYGDRGQNLSDMRDVLENEYTNFSANDSYVNNVI
jgi:hypothetical protein